MNSVSARVLIVDDREGTLSRALSAALAGHEVETAHDPVDAIYRIDCVSRREWDCIFCDLARGDLPGPELWGYLSIQRKRMARRIVFVSSAPLSDKARAFLANVPNPCVALPLSGVEGLSELLFAHRSEGAERAILYP